MNVPVITELEYERSGSDMHSYAIVGTRPRQVCVYKNDDGTWGIAPIGVTELPTVDYVDAMTVQCLLFEFMAGA